MGLDFSDEELEKLPFIRRLKMFQMLLNTPRAGENQWEVLALKDKFQNSN